MFDIKYLKLFKVNCTVNLKYSKSTWTIITKKYKSIIFYYYQTCGKNIRRSIPILSNLCDKI